jgi:hypothetical protein
MPLSGEAMPTLREGMAPAPGTVWQTPDIWVRQTFELEHEPANVYLLVYGSAGTEVYVNGVRLVSLWGWQGTWVYYSLHGERGLRRGGNVVAVHSRTDGGAALLDFDLVALGG